VEEERKRWEGESGVDDKSPVCWKGAAADKLRCARARQLMEILA